MNSIQRVPELSSRAKAAGHMDNDNNNNNPHHTIDCMNLWNNKIILSLDNYEKGVR
jgi:hypothetical protein